MKQEKYFSLRNIIFDYKLTGNEFLVYSYLTKCCNRKTGIAWPSVPTIAKECDIGETTVRLATKNLEKIGLIKIKETYESGKTNRQTSNRYFLKPLHAGYGGVPNVFGCPPPTESDGEIYKQQKERTIINEQQSSSNAEDDVQSEQFFNLLDNCYFHPSRDISYPSATIKNIARQSMEFLWDMKNIKIDAKTYSQKDIRYSIISELMPEILDRAIEVFMNAKDVKSDVPYLAACIFRCLKTYDIYIERLLHQTFHTQ